MMGYSYKQWMRHRAMYGLYIGGGVGIAVGIMFIVLGVFALMLKADKVPAEVLWLLFGGGALFAVVGIVLIVVGRLTRIEYIFDYGFEDEDEYDQ